MAWNQFLSDQASSLVTARPPVTAGEWAARIALSASFLFLASFSISQIAALHLQQLDLLGWARLISSGSTIGFLILVAWLTLVRSAPVARALGAMPRIAAGLGTWLFLLGSPFLTRRTDLSASFLLAAASLTLLGGLSTLLFLRWLGRSFTIVPEAHKLVTTGPYRIIRHPLYAAELMATIGIVLQFSTIEAAALLALQFGFQILRMRNEEAVLLRAFPEYAAYMARTPRLIPGVW
jgi:protein-S-isoprenylcysteine O-methyltransferase Ste14